MKRNSLLLKLSVCLLALLMIAPCASADLSRGSRGEDVRRLQNMLIDLGFLQDKADGIFGKNTQDAVKLFQARNGLTVDGKVGQRTLERLSSPDAVPADGKAPEKQPEPDTNGSNEPEAVPEEN